MTDEPWVDENGATDVDGWLAAYAQDDNVYWATASGHIQNVVDELIDRLESVAPLVLTAEEREHIGDVIGPGVWRTVEDAALAQRWRDIRAAIRDKKGVR